MTTELPVRQSGGPLGSARLIPLPPGSDERADDGGSDTLRGSELTLLEDAESDPLSTEAVAAAAPECTAAFHRDRPVGRRSNAGPVSKCGAA